MTKGKAANTKKLKSNIFKFGVSLSAVIVLVCGIFATTASAASFNVGMTTGDGGEFGAIELMLMLMVMALIPSLLLMATSFTRIIIVLSLLRSALGTQQSPPNQVLLGLALFLTLFIMQPVLSQANTEAIQPYLDGNITTEVAMERAVKPFKVFMAKQVTQKDLSLFLNISQTTLPENIDEMDVDERNEVLSELSISVLVPAFMTSELKRAFTIGFLLFLPFLIIDMVVSSTLMSMGMVMLPPSTVSLPFKLLMFVLVDGWGLVFNSLVVGFNK